LSTFVCAVDLGSSFIKAALVDPHGGIASSSKVPAPQTQGRDARFSPEACVHGACEAIADALAQASIPADAVCGVALSSQRASLVAVGRDGFAAAPAWSWQGTACEDTAESFFDRFGRQRFRAITGLLPGAIYSVAKLAHLRQSEDALFRKAHRFVLLHDYVLSRLGAHDYFTDASNGSATGLMNTSKRTWSPEVLDALRLDMDRLSSCQPAGSRAGVVSEEVARLSGLQQGTPLYVGGGDQQCAVLGAGAVDQGTSVLSLGTSAVLMCPVHEPADSSVKGLLCTAHIVPDRWMLEGFQSCFGGAFRWAGAILGTGSYEELVRLAAHAKPGAGGLLFLPFLTGIASPEFETAVRGAWVGAALEHGRPALARSVFEGVVFETKRVVAQVQHVVPIHRLRVVGGGAKGAFLTRMLADILQIEVEVLAQPQVALLGAAATAWLGNGRFANLAEAAASLLAKPAASIVPASPNDRIETQFEA